MGIMADDLMAAVYANLVLRAAVALSSRLVW
jgi:phosphatidylglycerophosphatase A